MSIDKFFLVQDRDDATIGLFTLNGLKAFLEKKLGEVSESDDVDYITVMRPDQGRTWGGECSYVVSYDIDNGLICYDNLMVPLPKFIQILS